MILYNNLFLNLSINMLAEGSSIILVFIYTDLILLKMQERWSLSQLSPWRRQITPRTGHQFITRVTHRHMRRTRMHTHCLKKSIWNCQLTSDALFLNCGRQLKHLKKTYACTEACLDKNSLLMETEQFSLK